MKSWTQGCALEARVEVLLQSQAISKGPRTHAWPLETLQNAAPLSQISIIGMKIIFAKTSKGSKGAFARISIKEAKEMFVLISKEAKGTIVPVFNQGSAE